MTQRIFIWKIEPSHRLVDDDCGRALRIVEVCREWLLFEPADQWQRNASVSIAEESSFAQRYLHCAEVIVANGPARGLLVLSLRWIWTAFDREWCPAITVAEWCVRCRADRFNAR